MTDDYREIKLANLRLDSRNPRLPRDLHASDNPDSLLRHTARTYNLLELARSMADHGFAPKQAEALLVVEEPPDSGTYVVIEGNRRLATLLLLTDENRVKAFGLADEWDELAALAAKKGHKFDLVPVIVYPRREDLYEYVGFRHITGPTQWRPEAKARFIVELLSAGRSISDVWRNIGSNARTVRRYAEAHAVFEQVLQLGIPGGLVEAAFGVFYNALDTPGVRSFLGLSPSRDFDSMPMDPVPGEKLDELREFVSLLYGDGEDNLEGVLRESRELKKLSVVLLDDTASKILIESRDLDHAYRVAGGGRAEFLVLLRDSFSRLIEANGQAHEFKGDEEAKVVVRRLVELVRELAQRYELSDG